MRAYDRKTKENLELSWKDEFQEKVVDIYIEFL